MRNNLSLPLAAGCALKLLIGRHYGSQQGFAFDFGTDLRTVSRYVNEGINKLTTIEEIAFFFHMDSISFLQLGQEAMTDDARE